MKMKKRLTAATLLLCMLLTLFGGGFASAANTVTTDSELAFEPLAEAASIAYEKHETGYAVTLERAADSVTMNITAVPGSRAAEKAQLYVRTGVELKAGVAYRVSFSLSAEREQPEYAVCFDGAAAECAYGRLDKRSVMAGGEDQVRYEVTPEKDSGELVLRLQLGKTGAEGNKLRLSDLAVEEAVGEEVGESRVLADKLDYSEPGAITYWANEDSGATVTSDGSSATLTVTRRPAQGAEVWKIKLMVATGFKPEAGKTYRISYDIKSSAAGEFEVCYNEGETEKGYDVQYSQRLSAEKETRSRRIYVPGDKENPGELVLQLSLGKLGKNTRVTVSNVRVEEAVPTYKDVLAKDFAYDKTSVISEYDANNYNVTGTQKSTKIDLNGTLSVKPENDRAGNLTTTSDSATMEVKGGGEGNGWEAKLHINTGECLTVGTRYRVSFNIDSDVEYLNQDPRKCGILFGTPEKDRVYGDEFGALASGETSKSWDFTAESEKLSITFELGATNGAANTVTVSDITIAELEDKPVGDSLANVTYAEGEGKVENKGSFWVRDKGSTSQDEIRFDGDTVIYTRKDDAQGDGQGFSRGLFVRNICELSMGEKYQVSFKISANNDKVPFTVHYSDKDEWNNNLGTAKDDEANSEPHEVKSVVTGGEKLYLTIDLGYAANDTEITVSDIEVLKVESTPTNEESYSFGSVSTWAHDESSYEIKDVEQDADSVSFKVTKPDDLPSDQVETWKAKLSIAAGEYERGKAYRFKFNIAATEACNNFCVITSGFTINDDIRGTWVQTVPGGNRSKTITTRPIPANRATGPLSIDIELGIFDGTENTYTISDVYLEEVTIEPVRISSRTEGTVTNDMQRGYNASLTREKDSATLKLTSSPDTGAEAWKSKLFLNTGVSVRPDEACRVTFDVLTEQDADFEVCYNRGGEEKGYDAIYGLHTEGGTVRTIERVFTAEYAGTLIVQLSLGMVKAPNAVTISNLRVERITYSYSGKSVLPAGLSYKAPGAVSYWAHEDYTAAFTGSGNAVTANITNAPKTGAEPWKIKLFLDTGTPLEAGRYYKVTADVKAKADQDYEICYNNGGAEMGYSSLGGLHLAAGKAQTVEKTFAVPGGRTDLGNLTLQLNLGKTTSANEITVSGVKVEELPLSYVNAMAADFSYRSGAVELQADPDYTAALEQSADSAKLRITGVPATGAGVWKVKLLVNTGAVLQAGKTYLVRADLLAAKAQGYEVCFNNEETEKGFDALYGQTFTAGSKTTVERTISVPESMTDAGELVLQFSVGGDVTNDITVSGVSVQELDFGAGSGSGAPDTVISLKSTAGALDVTRGKLGCKIAGDDALTIAGADLRANDLYTVKFTARADKDMSGTFALAGNGGGAAVISEQFRLAAEEAEYSFTTKQPLSEGGLYDMLWQFDQTSGGNVEISDISVYSPPERLDIVHSAQSVTVNGKAAAPDIYNINGSNYFKLRDLAMLLNNTDGQFVVRYNKKDNSISLTTGKPYAPVGGELAIGEDRAASCVRTPQTVTVNGRGVNLKSYNIGGSNYFRLRDLGGLLGFAVDYIAETNTVAIASPLTPEAQEKAHGYDIFFLPDIDSESQGYVGDTMPYYENGVYYIYYLKDGGDSYNHSVYLTTTTDFVSYTEYDEPVLSASRGDVQDSWIGTGSVVKVESTYYFFYTGYNASGSQEYHEKIMVAKGSSPTSFEKVSGWEIVPPSSLGQKNDFRDPQAYYDAASKTVSLTVTASQDGKARILKYTLGKDLKNVSYDGIIFTDPTGAFFNLECSDTFRIGNKWYLTYSGQEDTLWYAMADSRFGPYSAPARLDGKLFYAAKHVEDGTNAYMVGWARRSNSVSSTNEVSGWAGNIAVQKLRQQSDGSLSLVPVDSIVSSFGTQMQPASGADKVSLKAGAERSYEKTFTSCESFMLSGEFTYTGTGSFGLAFDFNGKEEQYKLISVDPAANKLALSLNGGAAPITETQAALEANRKHSFTYIQDGSVGIFYLDGRASLTVRLYGVTDKPIYLFAENNSVEFTSLRQYT